MFLNFFEIIGIISSIMLLLFIIIISFCLIKTIAFKNKGIRILQRDDVPKEVQEELGKKLLDYIKIRTKTFSNEENYHIFREKLKVDYPLIHQNFNKERIDGNVIFTYNKHIDNAPNILYATHVDSIEEYQEPCLTKKHLYGNETFDAKALFFVVFEAVEKILREDHELKNNLTLVITIDDEGKKTGEDKIINKFLKEGKFFHLIIEEGSGIMDPISSGLRSHHAFIGTGVTGEAVFRFKTSKSGRGESRLQAFTTEVRNINLFKTYIDNETRKTITSIAKDMTFSNRLIYGNPLIFKPIIRQLIDNDQIEISKMLKTQIIYGVSDESDDYCYIDLTFELSYHDTIPDIVCALEKIMQKNSIEYELISSTEGTKITSTNSYGYKIVSKVIEETFDSVYISPYIISSIAENREYDKVSDNVIRFSPLYYSHNAKINKENNNEYVSLNSLGKGVEFFDRLTRECIKR